jgi:hypothetical protein
VSYLFPKVVGVGKLQPYARNVNNNPSDAGSSDSIELGMNYIVYGNIHKWNLNYVSGDTNASGFAGRDLDTLTLGVQLQF